MIKSSRQVFLVSTSSPEKKVSLLKPAYYHERLDDNCDDNEWSDTLTRNVKTSENSEAKSSLCEGCRHTGWNMYRRKSYM